MNKKVIIEITVPAGKEYAVEDEYEFTSLIANTLTKKWFGNGAFVCRYINQYYESLEACESVLSDWHSKTSNMDKKEPKYINQIRVVLQKTTQ